MSSAALLLIAGTAADVQGGTDDFHPTFEFTSFYPITPGVNGFIVRELTVPAGDHLPAIEDLTVPPDQDIAADGAVPNGDKVGSGFLSADQGCDGSIQGFGFSILDQPADPGDKAHWTAVVNASLVFDFVVTGSAATGHNIQALLFSNPAVHGPYCAPMDLQITHRGVSDPAGVPVFTNPTTQGVYTWSSQLGSSPLPAEHIVTRTDSVAIGPDADGDLVPDFMDNCPNTPNGPNQAGQLGIGNQTDMDGDSLGDACDPDDDGDTICDPGQSDPSCSGSDNCQFVPEDFDPDPYQDDDGCPEIDNDQDTICDPGKVFPSCSGSDDCPGSGATAGPDGIAGTADDNPITAEDFDGVLDADGCYDPPGADFDGDGWADDVEALYLATDPALCCSQTPDPNDEDPDPCPPDFNDSQVIGIDDIFFAAARFNASSGEGNFTPRTELASQNGIIGIDDIFAVSSRFNQSC